MKNYKIALFNSSLFSFLTGINFLLLMFYLIKSDHRGIGISGISMIICALCAYGFIERAVDLLNER